MKKKIFFRWLKVIVLVYSIVGICFYYFQEEIMFHPEKIDKNIPYSFKVPFKEVNIVNDTNTVFNLVQFFPKDSLPKGVVLYFHGNQKNIYRYEYFVNNFTKNGYEVWICDYPGFGKSTGEFKESVLYEEAIQMYKMANAKYSNDSIVVYGKSLGTGIASYLASRKNCKRLILETPYIDMVSVMRRYLWMYPIKRMLKFNIPQQKYIEQVVAPITIFHGTNDGVLSYKTTSTLKEVLKAKDEFVTIEGGSHNTLPDYPLYKQKLDSLLAH